MAWRCYRIPENQPDHSVPDFLERNKDRPGVAIQGLGFVGFAMLLVAANSKEYTQYAAEGEDTYWKVGDLADGCCPVISSDPSVDLYYREASDVGSIIATSVALVYQHASVIIVDINLGVLKYKGQGGFISDGDAPMIGLESATTSIGKRQA